MRVCSICGLYHGDPPLAYSIKAPDAFIALTETERETRAQMNGEQCVIDSSRFYLRGRIAVPILDPPKNVIENAAGDGVAKTEAPLFVWGMWAELSPKTYQRTNAMWHTQGRENEPTSIVYMATKLPLYPETTNLELSMHTQPVGRRPHFFVLDSQHPLAMEQHRGVTMERVAEIADQMEHPELFIKETEEPLG